MSKKEIIMDTVKKYLRKYFLDAMSAMALGLFASLLIGTIFDTIGTYTGLEFFKEINTYAKGATGMAIGCAMAAAMKAHPLVVCTSAVVGSIGYGLAGAGPAGAFFAVIVGVELGMLVSKKTKVDIIVTPTVTLLAGFGVAKLLCPGIAFIMTALGNFINEATVLAPLFMGIIIAVVVGVILTLPISSAAICASIAISGLAGGAAAVGCCCQMVGFAVISFRENRWGGVVAQGLGTSMLQMGNICRRPQIWIAPTLASAICGPLSTLVFKLECVGVSAGMGTCGLVGPIGIISATPNGALKWIGIPLLCIVAPAVLSLIFNEILRKIGLVKTGDMALDL